MKATRAKSAEDVVIDRGIERVRQASETMTDAEIAVLVPTTVSSVLRWRTGKVRMSYFAACQVLRVVPVTKGGKA